MQNAGEFKRSINGDVQGNPDTSSERTDSGVISATMGGVIMLTWLDHRRTRELCAGLGFELAVMTTPRRGVVRYLLLSARSLTLLWRCRPRVLIVQNPSMVLAVLAVLVRAYFGFRL